MPAKHGLGRGLRALIHEGTEPAPTAERQGGLTTVPIEKIRRNRLQPRQTFDPAPLAELAASMRERGVLQPLLVRAAADGYELIAGERRLRAATEAGLAEVPVTVIEAADSDALELALVENLQREDLGILEEAGGYQVLAQRFKLTQEQIAARVGKARASVANALRILALPEEIKRLVSEGQLSAGHAKLLSGLEIPEEQLMVARRAARENLSVRNLEKLLQRERKVPRKPRASRADMPSSHAAYLCDKLHGHFGTSVRVSASRTYANGKKGKGTIEIDYYSNEDLDRILEVLGIELD